MVRHDNLRLSLALIYRLSDKVEATLMLLIEIIRRQAMTVI